jgi:hypothetical protein
MVEIELFPTQTETDCLLVIVLSPTGVAYRNQCGGTACEQKSAEGFLIPVGTVEDLTAVTSWFLRRFGESCWCDGRLAADATVAQELSDVVAKIPCWADGNLIPLELDFQRLTAGCEAWVPIRSPHGVGWLTWTNSD